MKKNILIFSTFIAVVVILFFTIQNKTLKTAPQILSNHVDEPLDTKIKNIDIPVQINNTKKLDIVHTPNKIQEIQKSENTQETYTMPLYTTISQKEAEMTLQSRKNIAPIAAIQIESNIIKNLKINSILTLPDIEGMDYALNITDAQHTDNSSSATGKYEDEGISYTTTITQGKDTSYITLATPNGSYEIETKNGIGYIYKTSDIRKVLHTNRKNDMILFPMPKVPLE